MTVPVQKPSISYVGNGATKAFAFPFAILESADLVVLLNGASQTVGAQYTIDGIGNPSGGTVTFVTAPASGVAIMLYREVSIERDTDYQDNGDLLADTVNADFDRIWMAIQDGNFELSRAVRVPRSDINPNMTLPPANQRANKALGFDNDGNPFPIDLTIGSVLTPVLHNIAMLRLVSKFFTTDVFVTGYHTAGDGGGGSYSLDPTDHTSPDNGGTIIVAADGGRWIYNSKHVSICTFGAVPDGDAGSPTDNTAAIQSAWDYCSVRGIKLTAPQGSFALKGPVWLNNGSNFWSLSTFEGAGKHGTTFLSLGGSGADKLFTTTWQDGSTQDTSWDNKTIRGFTVAVHPTHENDIVHPIPFDLGVCGNFQFDDIRIIGFNNSAMRLDIQSNSKFTRVEIWNCGLSFDYKKRGNVTFATTAGSNVITASGPIFAPGDVGKVMSVHATSAGLYGVITSYISPTQVTFDSQAIETGSGGLGAFSSARTSGNAGDRTLDFDASPFVAEHVGLHCVSAGGADPWWQMKRLQITGINNPHNISIDVPIDYPFVNEQFVVPVVDFHNYSRLAFNSTQHNDIIFDDFWVENSGGVPLVMSDANNIRGTSLKLHGNWTYTDSKVTESSAWFSNVDGFMNLLCDSYHTNYASIRVLHQSNAILKFPMIEGVFYQNTCIVRVGIQKQSDTPGAVLIEDISCLSTKNDNVWITDHNTEDTYSSENGGDGSGSSFFTPRVFHRGSAIGSGFANNGYIGRISSIPFFLMDGHGNRTDQHDVMQYVDMGPMAFITLPFRGSIDTTGLNGDDEVSIRMPNDFLTFGNASGVIDLAVSGIPGPFYLFNRPGSYDGLGIKAMSLGRALRVGEIAGAGMGGGSGAFFRKQQA